MDFFVLEMLQYNRQTGSQTIKHTRTAVLDLALPETKAGNGWSWVIVCTDPENRKADPYYEKKISNLRYCLLYVASCMSRI